MKTPKKLYMGIGALLLAFFVGVLMFFPTQRVLAAGASSVSDVVACGNTLEFQDIAHITCSTPEGKVTFTDVNPGDSGTTSNGYYAVNYTPDGIFCSQGIDGLAGSNGSYHTGVTRRGSDNNFVISDAGKVISVKLNVGYTKPDGTCTRVDAAHQDYDIPGARTQGIKNLLQFGGNGQTAGSLNGITQSALAGHSYNLVGGYTYNNSTVAFTQGFNAGVCSGEVVMYNTADTTAKRYTLNGSNQSLAAYPDLLNFLTTQNTAGCYINEGDTNFGLGSGGFGITGTPPTISTATNSTTTPTGGTTQTPTSCESISSSPFTWLLCWPLDAASAATNGIVGLFEDQLSFTLDSNSLNGGTVYCQQQAKANPGNPNACQDKVKAVWSIIRDISSALVVIIMLFMVISQAISWGFFDAYTVKKILPRLVVAVIIMQISWPLFGGIVNLVDGIGRGLADLMYYPFGGANNMDLGHLLYNAHITASPGWDTLAILGGLTAGVLAIAALPALVAFVVTGLFSLLVGFITLMFRKILIIMCLIFAPLALLTWILPGTQNYFKLWKDNFTKALLMFPLVVAIVAAGRIFAYIAGTQNTGTGSVFLNFTLIMVGFFGPLFILPKTFKWGGSIMSSVGGTIQSIMKPASEKTAGGAKGIAERWQGGGAKQYNPDDRRGLRGWANRTGRRIQSGHIVPFSKRSQLLAIQTGDKWSTEQEEMAQGLIKRKGEKAMNGYKTTLRMDDGREAVYVRDATGQHYLDEEGRVTDDKDKAAKRAVEAGETGDIKELKDVAAMKQMWVDLSENGRDRFEKKMAIRQLTATASWPEVQGSFTPLGKRVIDTDEWAKSITTSPEDYPRVLRSRVDAAPHVVEAASDAAEKRGYAKEDQSVEARNVRSQERVKYAIQKQMSNEDFATQSDGFWQEAERISKLTNDQGELLPESAEIREELRKRFQAIAATGDTAAQSMLGHLAGGSVRGNVDEILGGQGLAEFLPGTRRAAANQPPAGGNPPPGGDFGGGGAAIGHQDNAGPRIITPDDPNFRPPGPGDLPR